jgi:hypothetical protein
LLIPGLRDVDDVDVVVEGREATGIAIVEELVCI